MQTHYLVTRHAEDCEPLALLSFEDEAVAADHATQAEELTGVTHRVSSIVHAVEAPQTLQRYQLLLDFELDGTERWRHESPVTTFQGHPDAVDAPSRQWRMIVRGAPSQPPSRIRVEITGPDRDWCLARAHECWLQARMTEEYSEAVAIEEMFAAT